MAKHAKHSKDNIEALEEEIGINNDNIEHNENEEGKSLRDSDTKSTPDQELDLNERTEMEFEVEDELIELEFDEESVKYYIYDEEDNEIGVCLIEDDELVEYMYEKDINLTASKAVADLKVMRHDLNDVKEDAVNIASELKETMSDISGIYEDFKDSFRVFPKKKKK